MRGLVLINAYPCAEKFIVQGTRIAAALQSLGIETDVLKNGEGYAAVSANGEISVVLPG